MSINGSLSIENQSFPIISWIKYLFHKKYLILLSCETYSKMSFRNRFIVSGSNGLIHLSVPLINGRDQKIPFKDVRICYQEKWQFRHWRTITSCYNRAPYFNYYRGDLEKFFTNKWEFLFDWNLAVLEWLRPVLKFPGELIISAEEPNKGVEDARDKWMPKNFQSASLGFRYKQVFEEKIGFQNNLSILDLLFNEGPRVRDLLTGNSQRSF